MNNISLTITKLIPGGQGLATLPDGRKIFLWNVLDGEIVTSFDLTKKKSKYLEGIATSFSHTSPHRTAPRDDFYLSNSPWQIFSYPYELQQKSLLIQESFAQEGITISAPEIKTDHREYFYRNKMEYSLYWDNNTEKISLAVHARGSHRKLPIYNSSLERPEIFTAAQNIVSELNKRHEEARKYQSLLLRCSADGTVSGGLYANGEPHPIFPPLSDTILGKSYTYSPNGFFQINLPVYELALQDIAKNITTNKILDLYSGVGTIGLSVQGNRELTLVESNKDAFRELEKNAADHGQAILSKSEDVLSYIAPDQSVILDPPRAGCDKKLLTRLLEVQPPAIIYLSCNPSTQARDVKILSEKYQISSVTAYNFFPKTPHIENLVILTKK